MKENESLDFDEYFGNLPEDSAELYLNEILMGKPLSQSYEEWIADIEKDYYSSNFKETNND